MLFAADGPAVQAEENFVYEQYNTMFFKDKELFFGRQKQKRK